MGQVGIEDDVEERLEEFVDDDSNIATDKKYLVSRAVEDFLDNKKQNTALSDFEEEDE